MGATSEYVCARLCCAFVAIGAEGFHVWEAITTVGVIFSNGRVPREGSGDPGDFSGVVVSHVEEVMLSAFVLDHGPERLFLSPDVEPRPAAIGR